MGKSFRQFTFCKTNIIVQYVLMKCGNFHKPKWRIFIFIIGFYK